MLSHKITYSFGSDKPVANDETCFGLAQYNDKQYLMSGNKPLISVDDLPLAGIHNALNCLAALALGNTVGWPIKEMVNALTSFSGLAHRCQLVPSHDGVTWINDSKATNVNATFYALECMDKQTIWIVGGVDKGNDYTDLLPLVREKVKAIICLGVDNQKIKDTFGNVVDIIVETAGAEEAVKVSYKLSEKGEAVLLSPACASFDLFTNYEDRGWQFKNAVKSL